MNWFDRISLLLTGLTALYLIWRFYGRYSKEKALYDIYYMMGFAVLFVSGVLLIFLGWIALASPYILTIATLIPLGISMGLMNQFMPQYKKAYSWFALLGLLAIAISSIGDMSWKSIAVPLVHGVAGLIIFGLPLYVSFSKESAPKGFAWVGIGGLLIGIGGIALAFLTSGRQLLFFSQDVVLMILAPLLLLMTLAFAWGFVKDIKAEQTS
jgi:FtsH-binding integral membrane protein